LPRPELWASRDEGRRWSCIARHLPEIYPLCPKDVLVIVPALSGG